MATPGNSGVKRLINATRCSLAGLNACFKKEAAFRQEVIFCAGLFVLSFFVARTLDDWLILNASAVLVLIVELLNSAIERAIDRISFDRHELSGEAKDMGSAAVMLSLIILAVCWGAIIFIHL